jgi:signal transduction histidine kinase
MAGADWARFVHPEDRERMGTHLSRALQRLEPATADYRIVRQDGATRWLTYAGQLQTTGQGTRLLGTVVDITDRKQSERALQRAKEEAESANHLKDRFLATLSHELRTPLNAILGYASMLRTNAIPPEKREQAIEVIERNAAAQTQLIEDLLDISRITRGQLRIEAVPVDVRAVIGDAIAVVAPAAEAKRIVVDVQLTDALDVVGDAARLQQIFWNLLTNAVKFTPPGGRVTVAARHAGSDVEVSVRDTGAGIASDFLPHIFEPFRQATSDLAGGRAGLGLGLAISRQLVELHGGTIAASSGGAGAGAAFVVRLPGRRHG